LAFVGWFRSESMLLLVLHSFSISVCLPGCGFVLLACRAYEIDKQWTLLIFFPFLGKYLFDLDMMIRRAAFASSSTKGLFGLGDIPKWLGIATEKVVATCLV
jgi:hypothetical protein